MLSAGTVSSTGLITYGSSFPVTATLSNETDAPAAVVTAKAAVRSYGESRTEENGYYYELSRTQEENGSSYVGMKLTSITLPDEYTVSADVNYANTGDIEFFMRDSSLNSGKVAVRAGITQSDNGGTFYAYSGRDKKIIMSNVAENGWFKLSFYVDNFTGTYYGPACSL